jgi:hypothetical protein
MQSSHRNDTSSGNCSLRQKILSLHRCAAADLPNIAALQLNLLVLVENKKQLFAVIEITGVSLSPGGQ